MVYCQQCPKILAVLVEGTAHWACPIILSPGDDLRHLDEVFWRVAAAVSVRVDLLMNTWSSVMAYCYFACQNCYTLSHATARQIIRLFGQINGNHTRSPRHHHHQHHLGRRWRAMFLVAARIKATAGSPSRLRIEKVPQRSASSIEPSQRRRCLNPAWGDYRQLYRSEWGAYHSQFELFCENSVLESIINL